MKETHSVLNHLLKGNTFCPDPSMLSSVRNGVHAQLTVNVDKAETMKDKATTVSTQSSVKIYGESIQRLTVTAKASQDLASVFKYELCSHQPALFDTSLLLRWPQKPMTFDEDMPITMKKDEFLGNNKNKQQFINMLSWLPEEYNLSNPKKSTNNSDVWNFTVLKQYLCRSACTHILFMHAILECDTTSRLYGIGEGAALNKVVSSYYFREKVTVFDTPSALKADVMAAGDNALVQQWKGNVDDLLPQNWEWKESNRVFFLSELTYHQLQSNSCRTSDAAARTDCSSLRCTYKKNPIKLRVLLYVATAKDQSVLIHFKRLNVIPGQLWATGNISDHRWDFPEYNTIGIVMEPTYNNEIEAVS
ncbi:hypothetical protein MAR_032816 [Mya arenaria]|uniref:Uncharacterized protein n=1 Tax=Mya arenaria TaxID=6604 RepID=A0ABY7GA04_MYAAR|nr:hypothetical protein MAR_032816 [Mya arenaria]